MTTHALAVRRFATVTGVVLSLAIGVTTIRAAAGWTASAASLGASPPTVESLQKALASERDRSAALQAQLDRLSVGSADLSAALDAARQRIADDTAQAQKLRAGLATAKSKLATLEQSIRAAAASRTSRPATTTTSAPAGGGEPEGDDD